MPKLIFLLQTYGVLIVFATVLVEQVGLPIPAFPVLIVAGALCVDGRFSWPLCLAVSLAACLISDYFWFRAGRHYGKRILKLLCRISLSPDYCVSQTEDNFRRHGPKALLVAKFIPGFNTVAPPLAGAMGTSTARFLSFSIAGALLWSAAGIGIGAYFHASIEVVLDVLGTMGSTALMVLGALLLMFVLFKYWERRRFQRAMQVERIGIDELMQMMASGAQPVIVDARSTTAQQLDAPIPGALIFNSAAPRQLLEAVDSERHIVVYCSCPNDVTAAQVAKQLHAIGFKRARPLHGGLDAWNARAGVNDAAGATPAIP
jgi:membrane protein DedA with SNARE-associated domain/rhodanese-related sulfurtransferase